MKTDIIGGELLAAILRLPADIVLVVVSNIVYKHTHTHTHTHTHVNMILYKICLSIYSATTKHCV